MNDLRCTQADVDQAAEELIALGRKACALHINDGVARLSFMRQVDAFVDEIVQDVVDGVISAQEGLETLWEEHEALRRKVGFYARNGVGVVAGVMQVELGVTTIGATRGLAAPVGGLLIAHGTNNIYEGFGNIYNGPDKEAVTGPTRWAYQQLAGSVHKGNLAYGAMDLSLSGYNVFKLTRKENSFLLFRYDPISYEPAYKQIGRPALIFEGIVDAITIWSMTTEESTE